ncbi:MAG: FtsW/RodA/SpoVE family cell cycle protein [Paludibacteraceae bacterium]|jgi:Bacterial cell division membrane protein|nr:FtsW/RodA/SpoVE family cell cycle protein [Paludibacteraceae bacterium]MBO7456105.1 FtsW/RodA/SpoVE family cell cycle protein [Paludibacteraceae bacterium]
MDNPSVLDTIKRKLKYVDKTYWTVFILLVVFAVLELFSASSTLAFKSGSLLGPVWHQVKFILIGALIGFVVQLFPSKYVRIGGYALLGVAAVCLYLMIIPGSPFVSTINDAERWFKIFGFSFQPSELAKLGLIIVVADRLSQAHDEQELVKEFYRTLILSAVIIFPILLGNLSTALLLGGVVFLMWFLARVPLKYLGAILAIAVVLLVSGYFIVEYGFVRAHRQMSGPFKRAITWVGRIDKFIADDDAVDDGGDDYQRTHATMAIARGGASPLGVLPGNSVERNWLPLAYADYIFAIIVEETGFIGALVLIILYVVILFRACYTSSKYADYSAMLMVMGLALMLTSQAFVSMAVAVGLGPVTGQPLPMVSRGGTSVLVTSLYFAILMCVSREQNEMQAQVEQSRADSYEDVPDIDLD